VIPDNLKTGVTDANYWDPVLNRSYHALGRHQNVAIVPARVRKPRDDHVADRRSFGRCPRPDRVHQAGRQLERNCRRRLDNRHRSADQLGLFDVSLRVRHVVDLGDLTDAFECTKRPWGGPCQSSRPPTLQAELSSIKIHKKRGRDPMNFFASR